MLNADLMNAEGERSRLAARLRAASARSPRAKRSARARPEEVRAPRQSSGSRGRKAELEGRDREGLARPATGPPAAGGSVAGTGRHLPRLHRRGAGHYPAERLRQPVHQPPREGLPPGGVGPPGARRRAPAQPRRRGRRTAPSSPPSPPGPVGFVASASDQQTGRPGDQPVIAPVLCAVPPPSRGDRNDRYPGALFIRSARPGEFRSQVVAVRRPLPPPSPPT